jgi:mono/diheme cytochrome c family protein
MTAWRAISSAGRRGFALGLALLAIGCGQHPAEQPSSGAYSRALRPMPAGTVARTGGEPAVPEDPTQLRSPLAPTPDNVSRGRELCRIYCAPCHGPLGHGDGPMAALLGVDVRDLAGETVAGLTDGELYAVITHGSGQMLGLRGLMPPADRWRCVLGVRDLARSAGDSAAATAVRP